MSKYFEIDGYWKDTKDEFYGLLVKEYDDVGEDDDDVFFYGMGEEELKEAVKYGEETALEFVVTNFTEV